MIWGNPWAWLGLAAIAVPIAVHLLARHASTALPFPTLRFLRATPLLNVRRRRLSDPLLLAVRVGIVALAVAALAQPHWPGPRGRGVHRLVVIDVSESVAAGEARAAAARYGEGAASLTTIERRDLTAAMQEAAGWMASTAGAREVVVVSDFQQGALDARSLEAVPAEAGITLHRAGHRELRESMAGVAQMTADGARTTARWTSDHIATEPIRIESAHDEPVRRAIANAAAATAAAYAGRLRPATFVLRNAPNRAALIDNAGPAGEPWMFDVMSAMAPGMAMNVRSGPDGVLVLLSTSDPATAVDAIRQAIPALALGPAAGEFEPRLMGDDELRGLEREGTGAGTSVPRSWAGRWFWIAALLLLGIEALLRRPRAVAEAELTRAA